MLTQERVIDPFFLDENIITSNFFLDILQNYALPQLDDDDNLILQLDSSPVHFAHTVYDCLNMNFPV
jgi:hypothetical protein